jgi:hypothetical protein
MRHRIFADGRLGDLNARRRGVSYTFPFTFAAPVQPAM